MQSGTTSSRTTAPSGTASPRGHTGVRCAAIELDEIWDFIGCKAKTAEAKGYHDERGDSWTWLAIDADSKMILELRRWASGRSARASEFLNRLNGTRSGRCRSYVGRPCDLHATTCRCRRFGTRVDFAQLIKSYASTQDETRYSPAKITGIDKQVRFGNPNENRISTSYPSG